MLSQFSRSLRHSPIHGGLIHGVLIAGVIQASQLQANQVNLEGTVFQAVAPAHEAPIHTFASPVSTLRFLPFIEVQGRNFAEAQADVNFRGGTFESTGFMMGPVTLLDPQTGHYFAEIPVPARMLTPPERLFGTANAFHGFNSTAGSLRWDWRPIEPGGEVSAGFGNNRLQTQSFYFGLVPSWEGLAEGLGFDLEAARSESDGTRAFGDHEFNRLAGRIRREKDLVATQFFAGYQAKFFGWPNLYAAPFNSNETENLQTTLLSLEHRFSPSPLGEATFATYFRRNKDNYTFDRFNPHAGNPFQHETRVFGGAVEGVQGVTSDFRVLYNLQGYADSMESTALFNREMSRSYWKAALLPEWDFHEQGPALWTIRAGLAYDDSNRFGGAVSPMAALQWKGEPARGIKTVSTVGYSESTQVPGYTATNSSPDAGLFLGNPELGRERARQVDWSNRLSSGPWESEANIFFRWDRDLTDWVFQADRTSSRAAAPIATDTFGLEGAVGRAFGDDSRTSPGGRVNLSYAYLTKSFDYGGLEVDASFYALNYPRHRGTISAVYWFLPDWEFRVDADLRQQAPNLLRQSSRNSFRTFASLSYAPPLWEGLELTVSIDNPWKDGFEEVPGVPATGRQFLASAAYQW